MDLSPLTKDSFFDCDMRKKATTAVNLNERRKSRSSFHQIINRYKHEKEACSSEGEKSSLEKSFFRDLQPFMDELGDIVKDGEQWEALEFMKRTSFGKGGGV